MKFHKEVQEQSVEFSQVRLSMNLVSRSNLSVEYIDPFL